METKKENLSSKNMLGIVTARRAIRNFLPREVEQEKIDYILECVRLAPSAANFQPWYFYIVKSKEAKAAIYQSYTIGNIKGDPMFIIACGDSTKSWKRKIDGKDFIDVDVTIATEHLVLAATEQGLGTCWLAHFNVEKLKELLEIPEHLTPIALLPIGYPQTELPKQPERKSVGEIYKVL